MTIDLTPALVQHSQHLLNSFKAFTNQDLIDRTSSLDVQARNLFEAKFVIVSHNTDQDPIFNYAHLLAWAIVVLCIALHVLMNARVGGSALLMSILNWRFRKSDHPALWSVHILEWLSDLRLNQPPNWLRSNSTLIALEAFVLTSLGAAWIIPLY